MIAISKKTHTMMSHHGFSLVPCENYDSKTTLPRDAQFYLRKRYYVAGLCFIGFLINYLLRINVSICVVDMTSSKTYVVGNMTYTKPAEFFWTAPEKGLILSAISWGMLFAPVGVFIADRFGGVTVYGFSILFTGCMTILSPTLISAGIYFFMGVRILEGLFESLAAVSIYVIFVEWVPQSERSRLINLVHLGISFGAMLNYPLSGLISYKLGWRYVFYITGGSAVIWYAVWISSVTNTPDSDKFITEVEKNYLKEINNPSEQPKEKMAHPWKSILTSKTVWAYLNERFVESWSLSFLTYCLPLYIKDIHAVNIKDIGFLSAIPHFCAVCSIIAGSCLQDYVRNSRTMSRTKMHKSFILFGQLFAVILLIMAGMWIDFYANMILFCIFKICFSIAEVSYHVLPVDLAREHSNLLMALSMSSLSLGYLLNPIFMGFMVQHNSHAEWSRYFIFLCSFNLWGVLIFAKYGSGELQPWAQPERKANGKKISSTESN